MNEKNEINNSEVKQWVANTIINSLMQNSMLSQNDLANLQIEYGYIFTRSDGFVEVLAKITSGDKVNYCAIQENNLQILEINDAYFETVVSQMREMHPCLQEQTSGASEAPETSESPQFTQSAQPARGDKLGERKAKNIEYLRNKGVTVAEKMECRSEEGVRLRNLDDICRRAIACVLAVQTACDINQGNDYNESVSIINEKLAQYGVQDALNGKERRILDGSYTEQDCYDMDWAYEAYWVLCYALGLVDDICDASETCDGDEALGFVISHKSFDDFKASCHLRGLDEILDMEDLYHRYYWAVNDTKVNPESSYGDAEPSNIMERYRALIWLISDVEDWYDLDLIG